MALGSRWQRVARVIHDEYRDYHRGAMADGETCILYGVDAYGTDRRSQAQVEAIRAALRGEEVRELEFATAGNGHTWAMRVASADVAGLHRLVWRCWANACGVNTDRLEDVPAEIVAQCELARSATWRG